MENPDHNNESGSNPKRTRIKVDVANLPMDLGLRIKISNYHPNERDQIRRHYLQNKASQLVNHDFPQSQFGKTKLRFNPVWFKEFPNWLEYSITKDAAYCCLLILLLLILLLILINFFKINFLLPILSFNLAPPDLNSWLRHCSTLLTFFLTY